jgi:AcrR family transcriptional regulator
VSDNGPVMESTPGGASALGGTTQRQRILEIALSLMSQRGVDGTSMRDIATAAGLNVASLYHYFPSKRDLLVAVLEARGYLSEMEGGAPTDGEPNTPLVLADLLDDMLRSMLDVEDFVRLMLGEVMRGDVTALGVGRELLSATQEALERWLTDTQPELCARTGAAPLARMLRSMLVGVFFEHVAGLLDGDDVHQALRQRAEEAADVLRAR